MHRLLSPVICLLLAAVLLIPAAALADKTITITFGGDVTLGGEDYLRDTEGSFDSVYAREGADYFLSNFADFFAEDDLTIVNLEGVLTDNFDLRPMDKGNGTDIGDGYWFRGRTEYVNILKNASIEAVSLANNHALDFGEQGLKDTVAALEGAGIEWFATRDRHKHETERFWFYEKDGIRIAFVSLYWGDYGQGTPDGCGSWLSSEIKKIKASGEVNAIIAVYHGGQEYSPYRTHPQTVFTKMAMKAGVDLVITHHAHVVLGMDIINNRMAFHSVGNFVFGGNQETYQVRPKAFHKIRDAAPAILVRAELTFADDGTYKGQQLTIYPIQTTSVDRGNDDEQVNDYKPKFVTGELAANILQRMWKDMMSDVQDQPNRQLRAFIKEQIDPLKAMESSEGMYSLTLPYLPAEAE